MGKDNEQQGRDSGCDTASCYAEEIQAWEGIHSARYILEDISVEQMSNITGLPVGVVFEAFKNIFDCNPMSSIPPQPIKGEGRRARTNLA